jgi:hypothetical protein
MNKEIIEGDKLIARKIYILRGEKVMLDFDLAELYNVETKRLKEQVRRNLQRFPTDFMFELNTSELNVLRSQFATSKIEEKRGGIRYAPMAFTEQGISMLSSILNSEQAIAVNIEIIRLFTRMRKIIMQNKDIMLKLEELEKRISKSESRSEKFEKEVQLIFQALKQLLDPVRPERKRIGF